MSIPYHEHPAYGSVFPTDTGNDTWQCIHPTCGALFDLSAPNHAATIYHHIRIVHNFRSRPLIPASNPQENFFNRDTAREADHKHQMNRLAHARAGLPTPDKRMRQSVWEPGFGVRFEGEAGGRWRCAACSKSWRDDPKIVQRHLREEHHVLTTTVVREDEETETIVIRD